MSLHVAQQLLRVGQSTALQKPLLLRDNEDSEAHLFTTSHDESIDGKEDDCMGTFQRIHELNKPDPQIVVP